METRSENIKNISEVEAFAREEGTKFAFMGRRMATETGSNMIGCNYMEVPAGKQAFPHHYHCGNDEAIFIIEGQGEVRIGEKKYTVGKNDFISFPVGPDHAHSLKNTGTETMRYLCMSSQNPCEVVGYPDSNKVGVMAAPNSGKDFFTKAWFLKFFKNDEGLQYYDGEKTDW